MKLMIITLADEAQLSLAKASAEALELPYVITHVAEAHKPLPPVYGRVVNWNETEVRTDKNCVCTGIYYVGDTEPFGLPSKAFTLRSADGKEGQAMITDIIHSAGRWSVQIERV